MKPPPPPRLPYPKIPAPAPINAILTGSYAYGTPRENSDVDLVVLVSKDDAKRLGHLLEIAESDDTNGSGRPDSISLRCGRLNLLVETEKEKFDCWVKGTQQLIIERPVSRAHAVKVFRNLMGR